MLTPEVCRAARGLLGWTLENLAEAAGVGLMTISAFERGRPAYGSTKAKLVEAFEREGVELILEEARTGAALVMARRRVAP
jgi:transcriptional regulator with XRE-family HTH domain